MKLMCLLTDNHMEGILILENENGSYPMSLLVPEIHILGVVDHGKNNSALILLVHPTNRPFYSSS